MSWNVNMRAVKEVFIDVANVTWNLQPMFTKAFGTDFRNALSGKTGKELIPVLQSTIENMKSNKKEFEQLNPENGWGNFNGAIDALQDILDACIENPQGVIDIY